MLYEYNMSVIKGTTYLVMTSYEKNQSIFVIQSKTTPPGSPASNKIIKKDEIVLPLITLERFKDRENFINKLRTYLVFS